jgi:FKBP-type peptidyl-prolyl cis-trans isomerase FklB
MVKGDVFEVTIPSELAYGARGAGGAIGPNSVLNFKIELLDIVGKTDL